MVNRLAIIVIIVCFMTGMDKIVIPDCKDSPFAAFGGYPRRGFYYPDYGFSPPGAGMRAGWQTFAPAVAAPIPASAAACVRLRPYAGRHECRPYVSRRNGQPDRNFCQPTRNFCQPTRGDAIPAAVVACVWSRCLPGDMNVAPTFPVVSVAATGNSVALSAIFGTTGRKTPGLCRRLAGVGRNFAPYHTKTSRYDHV